MAIVQESCQLTLGSGKMPSLHLCHKHKQPITSINPNNSFHPTDAISLTTHTVSKFMALRAQRTKTATHFNELVSQTIAESRVPLAQLTYGR